MEAKRFQPEDVHGGPARCKACGSDLRELIAEMLNDGTLKEDGQSVDYECTCGAPHHVSRTK